MSAHSPSSHGPRATHLGCADVLVSPLTSSSFVAAARCSASNSMQVAALTGVEPLIQEGMAPLATVRIPLPPLAPSTSSSHSSSSSRTAPPRRTALSSGRHTSVEVDAAAVSDVSGEVLTLSLRMGTVHGTVRTSSIGMSSSSVGDNVSSTDPTAVSLWGSCERTRGPRLSAPVQGRQTLRREALPERCLVPNLDRLQSLVHQHQGGGGGAESGELKHSPPPPPPPPRWPAAFDFSNPNTDTTNANGPSNEAHSQSMTPPSYPTAAPTVATALDPSLHRRLVPTLEAPTWTLMAGPVTVLVGSANATGTAKDNNSNDNNKEAEEASYDESDSSLCVFYVCRVVAARIDPRTGHTSVTGLLVEWRSPINIRSSSNNNSKDAAITAPSRRRPSWQGCSLQAQVLPIMNSANEEDADSGHESDGRREERRVGAAAVHVPLGASPPSAGQQASVWGITGALDASPVPPNTTSDDGPVVYSLFPSKDEHACLRLPRCTVRPAAAFRSDRDFCCAVVAGHCLLRRSMPPAAAATTATSIAALFGSGDTASSMLSPNTTSSTGGGGFGSRKQRAEQQRRQQAEGAAATTLLALDELQVHAAAVLLHFGPAVAARIATIAAALAPISKGSSLDCTTHTNGNTNRARGRHHLVVCAVATGAEPAALTNLYRPVSLGPCTTPSTTAGNNNNHHGPAPDPSAPNYWNVAVTRVSTATSTNADGFGTMPFAPVAVAGTRADDKNSDGASSSGAERYSLLEWAGGLQWAFEATVAAPNIHLVPAALAAVAVAGKAPARPLGIGRVRITLRPSTTSEQQEQPQPSDAQQKVPRQTSGSAPTASRRPPLRIEASERPVLQATYDNVSYAADENAGALHMPGTGGGTQSFFKSSSSSVSAASLPSLSQPPVTSNIDAMLKKYPAVAVVPLTSGPASAKDGGARYLLVALTRALVLVDAGLPHGRNIIAVLPCSVPTTTCVFSKGSFALSSSSSANSSQMSSSQTTTFIGTVSLTTPCTAPCAWRVLSWRLSMAPCEHNEGALAVQSFTWQEEGPVRIDKKRHAGAANNSGTTAGTSQALLPRSLSKANPKQPLLLLSDTILVPTTPLVLAALQRLLPPPPPCVHRAAAPQASLVVSAWDSGIVTLADAGQAPTPDTATVIGRFDPLDPANGGALTKAFAAVEAAVSAPVVRVVCGLGFASGRVLFFETLVQLDTDNAQDGGSLGSGASGTSSAVSGPGLLYDRMLHSGPVTAFVKVNSLERCWLEKPRTASARPAAAAGTSISDSCATACFSPLTPYNGNGNGQSPFAASPPLSMSIAGSSVGAGSTNPSIVGSGSADPLAGTLSNMPASPPQGAGGGAGAAAASFSGTALLGGCKTGGSTLDFHIASVSNSAGSVCLHRRGDLCRFAMLHGCAWDPIERLYVDASSEQCVIVASSGRAVVWHLATGTVERYLADPSEWAHAIDSRTDLLDHDGSAAPAAIATAELCQSIHTQLVRCGAFAADTHTHLRGVFATLAALPIAPHALEAFRTALDALGTHLSIPRSHTNSHSNSPPSSTAVVPLYEMLAVLAVVDALSNVSSPTTSSSDAPSSSATAAAGLSIASAAATIKDAIRSDCQWLAAGLSAHSDALQDRLQCHREQADRILTVLIELLPVLSPTTRIPPHLAAAAETLAEAAIATASNGPWCRHCAHGGRAAHGLLFELLCSAAMDLAARPASSQHLPTAIDIPYGPQGTASVALRGPDLSLVLQTVIAAYSSPRGPKQRSIIADTIAVLERSLPGRLRGTSTASAAARTEGDLLAADTAATALLVHMLGRRWGTLRHAVGDPPQLLRSLVVTGCLRAATAPLLRTTCTRALLAVLLALLRSSADSAGLWSMLTVWFHATGRAFHPELALADAASGGSSGGHHATPLVAPSAARPPNGEEALEPHRVFLLSLCTHLVQRAPADVAANNGFLPLTALVWHAIDPHSPHRAEREACFPAVAALFRAAVVALPHVSFQQKFQRLAVGHDDGRVSVFDAKAADLISTFEAFEAGRLGTTASSNHKGHAQHAPRGHAAAPAAPLQGSGGSVLSDALPKDVPLPPFAVVAVAYSNITHDVAVLSASLSAVRVYTATAQGGFLGFGASHSSFKLRRHVSLPSPPSGNNNSNRSVLLSPQTAVQSCRLQWLSPQCLQVTSPLHDRILVDIGGGGSM